MTKVRYAILALVLFTGIQANAQQTRDTVRPAQTGKVENARKQMIAELGLTKKQAQQFKEVNKEFAPKVKALRADSSLGKMEKRKQLMDLNRQREEKLKEFLTPEQMEKMRQFQKDQMKDRKNNKEGKEDDGNN